MDAPELFPLDSAEVSHLEALQRDKARAVSSTLCSFWETGRIPVDGVAWDLRDSALFKLVEAEACHE